MPDLQIRPFSDEHLDEAARLLAARHERHRASEPLLPECEDFRAEIEREWRSDGASGVIATVGDEAVGYVFGSPRPYGDTGTWMVVGIAGHAVNGDAERVRDLYAAAAAITESMARSPSFSTSAVPSDEAAEEEWRETWDDEQFEHFVAERNGRIVGHTLLYRRPPDLRVPANSIDLAAASTEPEARGSGVGRAMTAHVLAWAHAAGIPVMVIDWRMTNLFASRFWPRRGFRPTFLRLYRHLP